MTSNVPSKENQIKEILKCGKDSVYFMKKYTKIQHPKRGLLLFETYPFQDDCVKAFDEHRFNIVCKSRQLGLSTVTAAYAVWYAIFRKDKNILVIATKLKTAMNFIKKVKVMLDNVPRWLLLTKYEPTKQQVTFDNGSSITAIPTSPDAGRSEALSLLVVDEAAFIKDFSDIWTGLSPTISTGGSTIIISTPNGVGNTYHRLWTDAIAQTNEFNAIKLPWWVHPEHDQAWFDKETRSLTKQQIAQEFLCDFISSGTTFLQVDEMEYLRSMITAPIRREGPAAGVWIWSDPLPGKKYVISADVSRGDSHDYSAFHVISADDCEVVAEFMGKTPPDKLADMMLHYGKIYNEALLCQERNSFGYFTGVKLRDSGYKRLWYKNTYGDPFTFNQTDPEAIPGFETQSNSRTQILGCLEQLVRNKVLTSYSQRLYDQLQEFVWIGSKAQASRDSHDDLIISLSIGLWISGDNASKNFSSKERDMTLAMLKATSVVKKELPIVASSDGLTINRHVNPYKTPAKRSDVHRDNVTDFSWLMR